MSGTGPTYLVPVLTRWQNGGIEAKLLQSWGSALVPKNANLLFHLGFYTFRNLIVRKDPGQSLAGRLCLSVKEP
ncbi:hypothetical protein AB2B41_01095 [Marimonas sp. MJW-29]|uniref:Uncharacterized protein n=1 Tax=Sulfitobacter sediminis TaxID=3234186 RepID=A0ABV3RGV0_9RHOB